MNRFMVIIMKTGFAVLFLAVFAVILALGCAAAFGVPAMTHTPSSCLLLIASADSLVPMYSALRSSSVLPIRERCTLASSTVVEPAAPTEMCLPIKSSRESIPLSRVTTT